jgi:hypothetical protein
MGLPQLEALVAEIDDGDPLASLDAAEGLADELVALAARLVGRAVDDARAAGCSWADIGEHLGISRQAAQQKYTPRWASLSLSDLAAAGRLQRYTDKAKAVLTGAEDRARAAEHAAVAPAHLLLGVLDGDNVATRALRSLGVRIPNAVRGANRLLRDEAVAEVDAIPVGAAARRCLEATLTEALALGHNYIGTEHLLLGLLHDADVADLVGVEPGQVRVAIVSALTAMMRDRDLP